MCVFVKQNDKCACVCVEIVDDVERDINNLASSPFSVNLIIEERRTASVVCSDLRGRESY